KKQGVQRLTGTLHPLRLTRPDPPYAALVSRRRQAKEAASIIHDWPIQLFRAWEFLEVSDQVGDLFLFLEAWEHHLGLRHHILRLRQECCQGFVIPNQAILTSFYHCGGIPEAFVRTSGLADHAEKRGANLILVRINDVTGPALGEYLLTCGRILRLSWTCQQRGQWHQREHQITHKHFLILITVVSALLGTQSCQTSQPLRAIDPDRMPES